MNTKIRNRIGRNATLLLTAFSIIAGLFAPTALVQTNLKNQNTKPPQQMNQTTKASTVRITKSPRVMNAKSLRIPPRSPITFKPLDMVDPRTGKPVAANTMLTLDDGKTITAAKYYEQMNKLEAGLNKFGHSFRDQQKEVLIADSAFDKQKTLSQFKAMKFVTPSPQKAAQLAAIAQSQREYARSANPYFGKLPSPRAANARVSKGLFLDTVGPSLGTPRTASSTGRSPGGYTVLPKRPDLAPGDSAVTGLNSDSETLPSVNPSQGLAQPGKRASSIQINAAWPNIGFFVNYLSAPTAPLGPRYVWQVAKAGTTFDSFGPFAKEWSKDFDQDEMSNWKTPIGLIGSGPVSFLSPGSAPTKRERLFLIDFGKLVGAPPVKPALYLVRVVPVNSSGGISGYPSRPVLVSYGAEAPPKIVLPKPTPFPPAKFPANNINKSSPTSFGDQSVMSLDLNTWLTSAGTSLHEEAEIGFDAGCTVLGQPFSLLKIVAKGNVDARQIDGDGKITVQGKAHGEVAYYFLGIQLPCDQCSDTQSVTVSFPVDYATGLDEGFTFGFPIGPIDVSGTIGFKGTIGFGANVGISTIGVGNPVVLQAGPHVSAHVYLEGAAGIGVGGFDVLAIGVGGEVNLITAGFVVGVKIGIKDGEYFGRISELKALNGQLYGFAKAGICPFCKKWEVKLFDWGGYDMLASDPEKMTLFAGPLL